MENLGERLKFERKRNGYTHDSLAESIGVSRSVIFNLEKNKTAPKAVFINAITQVLKINKDWLINGTGDMVEESNYFRSHKILDELCEMAEELSEEEQRYLLDTAKSLQQLLNKRKED